MKILKKLKEDAEQVADAYGTEIPQPEGSTEPTSGEVEPVEGEDTEDVGEEVEYEFDKTYNEIMEELGISTSDSEDEAKEEGEEGIEDEGSEEGVNPEEDVEKPEGTV